MQKLVPDFAPLGGGAMIVLRGNNFMPFDFQTDINNANDTRPVLGLYSDFSEFRLTSSQPRVLGIRIRYKY